MNDKILIDREVVEKALHTMEKTASYDIPPTSQVRSSITALRAALEQPEQEPVAWRTFDGEGGHDYRTYDDNENYRDEWERRNPNHKGWVEPLYPHPPRREWVGLTDDEIDSVVPYCHNEFDLAEFKDFAGAIESALKEKNT